MEESEYITGYEKYRQYFETIQGMCDKEHLLHKIEHTQMVVDRQLSVYLEG